MYMYMYMYIPLCIHVYGSTNPIVNIQSGVKLEWASAMTCGFKNWPRFTARKVHLLLIKSSIIYTCTCK